ncbi:PREDICTED: general odorant-binding protein 19a-like, partial [Rhagoletis zephyria]|uniref:general odorant-binding protein 19a-like n=1 Tax=Rhagoletis zephyria TaxID=28612 RepID=UPI0008118D11
MWATAKLMRDVCLPRFPKISFELADQLRDGNIPDNNKDVKCYINCVLEMMQTMKKGKFLFDASL